MGLRITNNREKVFYMIYTGFSHVTGSGEPTREVDQFQHRCAVC
ncbi:unnamed protein product, partial [marine sediment metagenome]